MNVNRRDLASGLIFLAISAVFSLYALNTLPTGSSSRMGPGYFPLAVGGLLGVLAVVIIAKSLVSPRVRIDPWPLRGMFFILIAPLVFVAMIRVAGFALTILTVTLVTAFASRRMTFRLALPLSAGLTAFCVIVFVWGLNLGVPVLPPALNH